MTLPLPLPPPPPAPPPPTWTGPTAWPRPPRWLGVGTITRLTARELRSRRTATRLGITVGLVAGAGLAGAFGGPDHGAVRLASALVLLTTAAALADTTDPIQRDDAVVLVRLGCPRLVIRIAAWAGSVVALGVPAAIAAAVTAAIRGSASAGQATPPTNVGNMWLPALLLTAAGAAATAGTRLPARRGTSPRASRTGAVVRTVASAGLLLLGAATPAGSDSGATLDLSLIFGAFLVIVGLVGLAPGLARAATAMTARLPWVPARVAAATLAPQRRGLTMTIALLASLAAVLVVQTTVGHGLGVREQARVAAIRALGPATAAGTDRVVVVDRAATRVFGTGASPEPPSTRLADVVPAGSTTAEVVPLSVEMAPPGGPFGDVAQGTGGLFDDPGGSVALATPQLLHALGLDPALASGDRALVLDRRVIDDQGRVRLIAPDEDLIGSRAAGPQALRSATVVVPGAAWTALPQVLLPAPVFKGLPARVTRPRPHGRATTPHDLVVRYPERPTDAQIEGLHDARPDAEIHRGGRQVDLAASNRSDRTSLIWVRSPSDIRELLLGLGAMALIATAVALLTLRLAVRREDAVLDVLGARRRTMALVSGARGASIAAVATLFGAVLAIAATRFDLHSYNTHSRLGTAVVLAPIPWSLPTSVVVALLAVPVLAGGLGAATALIGPVARGRHDPATDR
ncbi:hypothetical protein [Aquihabitans sp. McL0605]|uniref:hypothetical protein n=1 Tax=Aquihabitans sp. McL0605 TaxID=3415671 RepID=UPI003CEC5012